MSYCSNVDLIVKHLDKVISLISKDTTRGLYSKTIQSYSEVSSRLEIIKDLCDRILSSNDGIIAKPGVDLVSWQKFLVLRSQERVLIDKLIDSLYDKNLYEPQQVESRLTSPDDSYCNKDRKSKELYQDLDSIQDNVYSNDNDYSNTIESEKDKPDNPLPYSFHNVKIKQDNQLDKGCISKYKCKVDEVDHILRHVYENCRDTDEIRLYESMYLWFHCRYVENPCPPDIKRYYGLNSISTWLCFLVIRYIHDCGYDRYENFVSVLDSWMQSIHDNPSTPFGTPSFITKKSLRKIKVDTDMLSNMDSRWRSFCNLFNRCSCNNNYSSKLDPNLMINKLEDPEALGIIER